MGDVGVADGEDDGNHGDDNTAMVLRVNRNGLHDNNSVRVERLVTVVH